MSSTGRSAGDHAEGRRPRFGPLDDEIGALAPLRTVVYCDARGAIVFGDLIAYSNGFAFNLTAVRRVADMMRLLSTRLDQEPEKALRVGVDYPDGRRATTTTGSFQPEEANGIYLVSRGGGGGGTSYASEFWASPLPPPGKVTLTVAWPVASIPETSVAIDAKLVLEAASRSARPWPAA